MPKPEHNENSKKYGQALINLASAIQTAGGSISLLEEYKDRPLDDFLMEVCGTNEIRFVHKIGG